MVRVLVVDNSPTVRMLLTEILNSDPQIRVIGTAVDMEQGVQQTLRLMPDLITMDNRMPRLDGLEAIRRIMEQRPTPIVVVSAKAAPPEAHIAFEAIEAGALDKIEKPAGVNHQDFEALRERLVTAVKLMAEVKVVRRRSGRLTGPIAPPVRPQGLLQTPAVLAVGASTGGPAALNTLLKALPRDFPLLVVVVQHMSAGFLAGLVSWLQRESSLHP